MAEACALNDGAGVEVVFGQLHPAFRVHEGGDGVLCVRSVVRLLFDLLAVDKQLGMAAILKRLKERGVTLPF